ncbi:MAG: sulfotransferase [Kiloniellaceae bacterium]
MSALKETRTHPQAEAAPRSILVVGLTQRVGTNYLGRLLTTHPDCTSPQTLYEDFLISGLPHLEGFVGTVTAHWREEWGAREKTPQLRRLLGAAVTEFMQHDSQNAGKRTVLKTPSVKGLEYAAVFLSDCDVVVLSRFGPDVVQSAMKSFGWTFESACQRWGEAAHYVADLAQQSQQSGQRAFLVVKYEDLVRETEATLRAVLGFAGLDPARFDFASLSDFPVYGSSTERGGKEKVHWQPVAKPKDFNPLGRSANWSAGAFRRFDWLTRGASRRLGYDLPYTYEDQPLSRFVNKLRDQKPRLHRRLQQHLQYRPATKS